MDLEEASGKKACTWSYQMVAHEYLKNDKSDNQKTGPGHTPMHESAKKEWSDKSVQRESLKSFAGRLKKYEL